MEYDRISTAMGVTGPSIARIYDYFLGGMANFEVDRDAAEALLALVPSQRTYARHNRDFLRRAVAHLARRGFDQFLDLGSGIPTVGNVHEIAHKIDPDARIAYVDIDPVAVHHSLQLLSAAGTPANVTAIQADMRDPEAVLAAPGVADLLDFSRPVAVLTVAILDIIDTRETRSAADLLAAYRDACAPGSALAVSNGAQMSWTDEDIAAAEAAFADTPTSVITWRSREQVAELFAGYEVLPPGVVPTAAWNPDRPVTDEQAAESNAWAAVGVRVSARTR